MIARRRVMCVVPALIAGAPLALMLTACGGGNSGSSGPAKNVLYTETNLVTPANSNSVLGYQRNSSTGVLTPLATPSFPTGGTGTAEPSLTPNGVLDTDRAMIVNPQHTLLFAVNQGSDTVAVFNIAASGNLTAVAGSPFASGGHAPVSLGLVGNILTVLNSSLDPARNTSDIAPNYTSFTVAANGALTPVPNSKVSLAAGTGPSIALPSPDGTLIFGANFLTAQLVVLQLSATGVLSEAPGSPATPDASLFTSGSAHRVLGVGVYPSTTRRIVYFNIPLEGKLAVYTYDTSGNLTFVRAVPNSGKVSCWIQINAAGTRLYTTNAVSGDVSVFDIGTDPLTPAQIQLLPITTIAGSANLNGNPWFEQIDPSGQFLYVLTPRDLGNTPAGSGNTLHTLKIASDGTLTEVPNSVVTLGVPVGTNPQGLVSF